MTSIFDRWTDLDPALALRRIEAAHGSAIFDRDSYTDPQRAIRQIESALDIELDDVAGLQDPRTLETAIDEAVGGSDAPEWLPSGAVFFIDTVNDHYYADGAERTKSDLLTDDSPTLYSFTSTMLMAWSGTEWTTVLQTNFSTDLTLQYSPPPDDGTNGFDITGGPGGSWSFFDYNGPDSPSVTAGGGSVSRLAVSATGATYSGSSDGGLAQSGSMGSPFPGNTRGTLSHINVTTDHIVVVVYPVATTDEDLSTLSVPS